MSVKILTDDEIADYAFTRELRQIDDEIRGKESDIAVLRKKRERLLTGEHDFKAYVKANRHFNSA